MSNFLIHSAYGESLCLALMLKKNGHNVMFYIEDNDSRIVGKDMGIDKPEDFFGCLNQYKNKKKELIIWFDESGAGDLADFLKDNGWQVGGAAQLCDDLEDKRQFATDMFSKYLAVPDTKSFTSFEDAFKFVNSQKEEIRLVFKPDEGETPKDWTFVSNNNEDLLAQMKYYQEHWKASTPVCFQLQEFIEGDTCDVGGFINWQKGWIKNSFEIYLEEKKVYTGDLGPATGCAYACEYFTTDKEPYVKNHLFKCTKILQQARYSGNFSINNIYSYKYKKWFFIEVNGRNGYDAFQNQCYILAKHGKDIGLLLESCVTGKPLPNDYFPLNEYALDVRFYIPPYPNEAHAKEAKGHSVRYDNSIKNNVMLYDVYYDTDSKEVQCAGTSGMIGTINTSSNTVDGAINDIYTNLFPKLNIANVGYRTDGGSRVKDTLKRLSQVDAILKPLDK